MWNGAANGDWANDSNWVWDNHTPGASDTARIDSAGPLIAAGTTGAVDTLFVSISNAADLSVAGTLNSGTVTLGYNSAASGTLSVSGGSWTNSGNLYIGNAGTGAVNLTNSAIASSYSANLGAVSGGSGSVIVDDANWTIGNGRIIVGDYGSGSLTLRNGATVSGPGGIIGGNVGGSGAVTVSDSNWTNTGNLYVGNAGNGTLTVNAGGTVTSVDGYVGTLTGSHSSVTVSGPGANWSLSGAFVAGYQSGTTADIVISNGGVISAVQGTLGDLAGASGTMLVTGSGSVWSAFVNPAIAYTGYMNVGLDGDGKLTVQNGGGVSGYQFYIGNNSTSTGTVTLSGAGSYISMTNNLFVGADGNGTLTVSDGALVSAKAIKIAYSVGSSGTLNIGAAAGQAPAAAGTISANQIIFGAGTGALVLNHTDDNYLVAANISGSGQVLVENGVTTLSGSNTYTGGTTVSGGRLIVDGSIANGLLTVNSGAVLSGTGTVGDTVMNGGTLALGNPGQTLTVSGNLSFTAASTYMIEVTPSASDRVNVTGTATLGGAAVNATFAAGSYVAKRYTILNATGGRVGSFSSLVSTNLPTNFASSLSYDANNAYLDLSLSYKPVNTNQSNVANALSGVFNAGGKMPVAFGALTPAGLSQAAGETSTGSQQTTFDAVNLFMGAMLDPFVAGRNDQVSPSAGGMSSYAEERGPRDAYAMFTKAMPVKADPLASSWNVWATGFGGSQTTDGNSATGSNTSTSRIYGVAVGADYRIAPNTIAGFAMSGGGTTFSVAKGARAAPICSRSALSHARASAVLISPPR
ncbi:autotransporter-associated beta strand repeat-containing protein [Rhodopseudomonas sp. AAP120]|uniref:autotransporter outer membrane beta-barrel domain-containing protein n=1 Tax=Rhodopseudomonas sp. AAP120 TaxID=1523430 RepID=UPI0006B8E7E3|nr:autotransporter-associated beta strand repeat-containing protein [Rhodopseudomonas sp. AAP120]